MSGQTSGLIEGIKVNLFSYSLFFTARKGEFVLYFEIFFEEDARENEEDIESIITITKNDKKRGFEEKIFQNFGNIEDVVQQAKPYIL